LITEPLDVIPLSVLFLAYGFFLCLTMESGYGLGWWRRSHVTDEKPEPVAEWQLRFLAW
jgi:hypothetical protein